MYYITYGTITTEDQSGKFSVTRTWEKVRETEKAILVRETMTITRKRTGASQTETAEGWLPKSALTEVNGYVWVKDFALTGKPFHPLKALTYEYGDASPELAARQVAAIAAGEGQWQ